MAGTVKRDGTRWMARTRDPDGRQIKKRFNRKVDADAWLVTVEASKRSGTYIDTSNLTTVAEFAEQYAAMRPHRTSTARRVGFQISTHIKGTRLGDMRLVQVRPSHVQAWATDRSQHLAPSTMRKLLGLLRSIFRAAELDG